MPYDGSELSQLVRDLVAVRQVLIDDGWCPQFGDALYGPNCIVTATHVPRGMSMDYSRREAVWNAIQAAVGAEDCAIWNDQQESVDTVLAAFDAAIGIALRS